ncbi:MAG: class I SAM-dependent rRNA methyltransferase [Myxococcota bacterium]
MANTLTVNGYSEKWLRQGFPWVYPNEVTTGRAKPGEVVRLVTAAGVVLGTALADDGWIAARRFRDDEGPLDAALIRARVDAAFALRHGALPPDTTAWRLVNAENDDLPGIRIDVWGTQVVITLDAAALSPLLDALADAVEALLSPRAILLAWRPDPREKDRPTPPPRVLRGTPEAEEPVSERGVAFLVRPGAGKDVGLFPDMRDNRAWLEPHWRGRSLLNLFAHTGAFSVSAAKHGAETVTVDLSQPYLDRAAANFAANGLPPGELLAEDSFKALDRFRRQGRRFDRVLLDPPGHSHSKDGTWSGEQDYARLVSAALRVLPPGGWLIAASNLGSVSPHRFQGMLVNGARKADRPLRMLHDGSQPLDFPAALHFPEGRFLKFVVCAAV